MMKRFFFLSLTMILALSAWGDIISEVYDFKGLNAEHTINRGESLGFTVNNGSNRTIYSFTIEGVDMDLSRFGGFIGGSTDASFTINKNGLLLKGRILSILNLRNGDKVKIEYKLASGGSLTLADATLVGNTTDNSFESGTEYTIATTESSVHLDIISSSNNNYITKVTVTPYYNIKEPGEVAGGSVTTDKTCAAAGEKVTITVVVPEGYELTGGKPTVINDETPVEVSTVEGQTNKFEFTMPAGDVTVSAAFELVNYSITYSGLEGASMDVMNPESYTIETETFTLINPTKEGSVFAGWTGTGLTEASTTVTIAKGSTGTRSYTATWTEETPVVEVSVNSAKTWTFDELTTDTEYKTYTEIGGAYLRSTQSGRSFKVTDCSEETLTFSSGVSATVSKYLYVNNNATYNGEEGTLTAASTAGDGGTAGRGMIAINATVAGTFYAKIAGATTGKVIRLYFADGSNIKNTSVTSDGTIQEISYTSTSAGSFFVGGITTGTSNIYAIRFAPTRTISIGSMTNGSVLADKSSAGEGETISLTVNPASGYELETISVNGTAIEGTTFTMPDADVTVTATFKELSASTYSVSLAEGETGVTFDKTSAAAGETVTITVVVPEGYELTGGKPTVINDETSIVVSAVEGQTNKFEFTMPAGDVTVSAAFELVNYSITYSGLEGASMDGMNPESYTIETETFTLINPTKEGSVFAGWTGTGLDAATTTVTIAKGSTGARSYTATWTEPAAPTTYTLTVTQPSEGGSIKIGDVEATTQDVVENQEVTLSAVAASGYEFDYWTVDGNKDTEHTTATLTITMNQAHSVTAAFKKSVEMMVSSTKAWTFDDLATETVYNSITLFNDAYLRGSSSPTRTLTVKALEAAQTLTFADGKEIEVNKYIASNAAASGAGSLTGASTAASTDKDTDSKLFGAGMFAVNATVPGTLYAKVSSVTANKKIRIYFADGTAIKNQTWTPADTEITEVSYTTAAENGGTFFVGGVEAAFNIYAVRFVPTSEAVKYTLTLTQPSEGGTIAATVNGEAVDGSKDVLPGVEVTLTATPADGYQMNNWKDGDGTAIGAIPQSISTTVTMPARAMTVTADFKAQPSEPASITGEAVWTFDGFTKGMKLSGAGVYEYNGLYIGGHSTTNFSTIASESSAVMTGISDDVTNYLSLAGGYNSDIAASVTTNTYKRDAISFHAGVPGTVSVYMSGSYAEGRTFNIWNGGTKYTTDMPNDNSTLLVTQEISTAGAVYNAASAGATRIYAIKFTPETVSAPTISQEGNTVTITAGASSISGASFITYYTMDGTDPTASTETFFTGASKEITISQDCTVKAITISGLSSTVTSLECTYTASSYALTLSSSENGTLTATVDGENVISGSNVTEGKAITLTATPSSDDYVLTSLTWEATDGSGAANDITTTKSFIMPGYAVTVKATFGSVYGEYDFKTWASDNLTTTDLVAASINDAGNLITTDKEMTLNGVFSIDGSFNVRKNNETTTGLQKPKGTTMLTINNLKAGDWFKIDCSTTLDVLVFTNNNVYQLDAANEEVNGKALLSGTVYVVKEDGNLPMIFGNAGGQTYLYKVEIRNSEVVPAPVINFDNDTKKATITRYQSNKGNAVTVYYTIDGNDPTTESSTYTDGTEIDVTSTMTIKAMSVANSIQSTIDSRTVTGVEQTLEAPTIAVEGTTVTITQGTASDTSTEVKTYYTLDNSDPTTSSTAQEYTEPFTLTATAYIKAYSRYNDAIGVSSEVTTYEKDGESKVRVGTFTAEENVYDFAAAAGDFQEISYAESATTVKYYYNADNTASEGNFYEITNTDYLTKSGNSAKILWREKGGEFSQANGGVMAKNGGQKYVAITGLSEGQRVVVDFNTANLKYNTATGEGEATVDGEALTRGSKLTSGKEITIASGSSIVFQVDGTTVITKVSVLPAVRCDLGVTLDGTRQWATYFAAADLAKPEGVTVYRVTGVADNVVNTEEVSYIKAGVGVLLYSETAVDEEKLIVGAGYGDDYTSELLGSVEEGTMEAGTNYVLYNNQFILAEDTTLPANRCYIHLSGSAASRGLTIEQGNGNTTGIEDIPKDERVQIKDQYYNMSGQRIEKPTKKGLYIVNGRKVIIK